MERSGHLPWAFSQASFSEGSLHRVTQPFLGYVRAGCTNPGYLVDGRRGSQRGTCSHFALKVRAQTVHSRSVQDQNAPWLNQRCVVPRIIAILLPRSRQPVHMLPWEAPGTLPSRYIPSPPQDLASQDPGPPVRMHVLAWPSGALLPSGASPLALVPSFMATLGSHPAHPNPK